MGKVKKKKFSVPKSRPTGLPSVEECEAEMNDLEFRNDAPSSTIQGIIENLQCPSDEARECACTTIAGIVSQPGAITALLKHNVIRILSPLMLDTSWDVRLKAVGALRNLSVDGGVKVCEEMIRQDVLTPLIALIQQFGGGDKLTEGQEPWGRQMIYDCFGHAFHVLLNLCENSRLAVTIFNKENLLPVVCSILGSSQATDELVLATVQCLHTVTEDNRELCQPELVECIKAMVTRPTNTPQQTFIKILATGVLVNLESANLSSAQTDLVASIVTTVGEVLGLEPAAVLLEMHKADGAGQGACGSYQSEQGAEESCRADSGMSETEVVAQEAVTDRRLRDIDFVVQAQIVALEIATNLCCTDDDDWEDMNSSESSCEEVENGETQADTEEMCTESPLSTPLCVSTEVHSAYVSCGIVQKVLLAAQSLMPEQEQVLQGLQGGSSLHKWFVSKQTHALLCVNNMVSALEPEALGGAEQLFEVWQGLQQLATSPRGTQDQSLLESVTSAMRAIIQKLAHLNPAKFQNIQSTDLQFMSEMSLKCEWPEIRVNALRIVSTIGGILAQSQAPHPLLKDIGVFLLEIVCKDTDLWVVAEALDAIFDVFGEDHVDPVAQQIGLVAKLKTVSPVLKAKVQANKKSLGQHYPVITTARTNLIRFIKYKTSR